MPLTDTLVLATSRPRRRFKELAGHCNHYLITILVGLDHVRSGKAEKGGSFSTSWNPADPKVSAERSADFARSALLAWLVDALDAYLRGLARKPWVGPAHLHSDLEAASPSVWREFCVARDALRLAPSPEAALTELAIQWRNRLVHSEATNPLDPIARDLIKTNAHVIHDGYQGLDALRLLEDFDAAISPRLKEATAQIRAVHRWVQDADAELLAATDPESYIEAVLQRHIEGDAERVAGLWGVDEATRMRKLRHIAKHAGFTIDGPEADHGLRVEPEIMEALAALTPREALHRFAPSR